MTRPVPSLRAPRLLRASAVASALAATAAMTTPASGWIVIRHDRPDSEYRVEEDRFPFLASVGPAHGSLIAPDWVITAAHVAADLSPLSGTIRIGGDDYPVARVVLHPSWIGDLAPGLAEPDWIDLALIQLARPVPGIDPVRLEEGRAEIGKNVLLLGRGQTGDGQSGPTASDGALRVAENRIEGADENWIQFSFDAPPRGLDHEGISGPGDSGGPALEMKDDIPFLMGVSSRNADPRGYGLCRYGTTEVYTRVSTRLDWIRETMISSPDRGAVRPFRGIWPATPAGILARELLDALESPDPGALLQFERTHRTENALAAVPAEARALLWKEQREAWGDLHPTCLVEMTPLDLTLIAPFARRVVRTIRLRVDEATGRLREVRVGREIPTGDLPLPDTAAGVRRALDAFLETTTDGDRAHPGGRHSLVRLGERTMSLARTTHDRGESLSALQVLSRICLALPAPDARPLRREALSWLVPLAGESSRARVMLSGSFIPALALAGDIGAEAKAYLDLLTELAAMTPAKEVRAELVHARILVRVEAHRWRDLAWLDAGELARTESDLEGLTAEYGDLQAPNGRTYEAVADGLREWLDSAAFGDPVDSGPLRDLDGRRIEAMAVRDRIVALTFWNSWCIPCMARIPEEREMIERLAGEPFTFLGVCCDSDPTTGAATARDRGMTWRNLFDPVTGESGSPSLGKTLGVSGYPSTIILDPEGKIRFKFLGTVFQPRYTTADVEEAVRTLLSEGRRE